MKRSSSSIGAAVGTLIAAGLVTLAAGSLYLRAHNSGEKAVVQAPADAYATAMVKQTLATVQNPTEVQGFLQKLVKGNDTIRSAMVVVEPKSTKYRFLRKRRYLANTVEKRVGQVLDRRSAADKAIYDLANTVRAKGPQLFPNYPLSSAFEVTAARPVMVDGKHHATAIVITTPKAPPVPVKGNVLLLALGGCVVLALIFGAALPKFRYLLLMPLLVGFGFFGAQTVGQLTSGYRGLLDKAGAGLIAALGDGAATIDAIALIPDSPTWVIWLAVALGLVVAAAGHLGRGERLVGALVRHRFAYSYIIPAALGMGLLVFIPFGYGLGLGFFRHDHGSYTFVGLANFVEVLSGGGRPLSHPLNFYFTLGVTVLWTGLNVFLHVAIGLSLALILKDPLLGFKGIYRVLLILPWAMPNYITALIWKGMFHYQYGAVNHVLSLVGIEKISWFSSFSTAFIANVTTNTWLGFPFMMVISLGALQSIPDDVYEAAAVDGASRWQQFWNITMPLLKPALFPAIVLGTIWTFNQFNIIYLVSEGAPAGASDILITEAYRWAFERADRYGLAAAYALIIFVILLAYTLATNRITKASEETY